MKYKIKSKKEELETALLSIIEDYEQLYGEEPTWEELVFYLKQGYKKI